jgi:hypothetical protein
VVLGVLVVVLLLGLAPGAGAQESLSLASSSPAIEENPITFTATGTASSTTVRGDSTEYVRGAVLPQRLPCPAGPDEGGEIAGSVFDTFTAFPTGPFDLTYRYRPGGRDLVAGDYHECGYIVDRESNSTTVSADQAFTVRRPAVTLRIGQLPPHFHFHYDTIGRPIASVVIPIRASVEVPGREILVRFKRAGASCAGNPESNDFGGTDHGPRPKAGPARTYRSHPDLVMHPGPFPYGRRLRVCVFVAYYEDAINRYLSEGVAKTTMLIRR